jgi:transposase
LAWSIQEKYEFALPFYRQAKRMEQIGLPISRATLCNLAIACAEACEPIYGLLKENILAGPVINADETRVQVLKEPGRSPQSQSWMWVFLGGEAGKESVLFQYETGRSHEVPFEFLSGYSGWLQTDDYEAYHTAVKRLRHEMKTGGAINHVLCWAHVRRKFFQYFENSKSLEAKKFLYLIRDLFALEDLRKNRSLQGFVKQRKNRAGPILEELLESLTESYKAVPPGLSLGKAISYTLDNWEQLILYLENPLLTPSNNSAENAIRPFVIGRKNWLFSNTPNGAKSSAILYSLVESAKKHGHSVYAYLCFILRRIPLCKSKADYVALLPYNIRPSDIQPE